jgi:hypothetical protein
MCNKSQLDFNVVYFLEKMKKEEKWAKKVFCPPSRLGCLFVRLGGGMATALEQIKARFEPKLSETFRSGKVQLELSINFLFQQTLLKHLTFKSISKFRWGFVRPQFVIIKRTGIDFTKLHFQPHILDKVSPKSNL